jgi:glucose-1-phosphate thymidylyltransferase
MQAILPLAGKGTRLRPLTHTRPKPLLRVANRPVLAYILDQLAEEGVDELICITGHLGGQIEHYLETEYPAFTKHYVEQVEQLGTADAIRLAEPFVTGPVLIVFVDTVFEADLGLIRQRPELDGIIWAKEVEDYQRFGVIITDDEGCMRKIVEKPSEPVSRLANIGVYFIRDHELMFEGIHHVMDNAPKLGEFFLTDAFQYMIDRGSRILTAEVGGWWDCGKAETLLETNRELLAQRRGICRDGTSDGELVCLEADVVAEDSELGPNVSVAAGSRVVRSRLSNSIVGAGSVVEDCDLHDSLIGDHATVRGVAGQINAGDHTVVEAAG